MTARCTLCMGALKIFGSPWLRPWLLFPNFLMGFCSYRLSLKMCMQNLNFVALPVPEIIGVPEKIGQSLDTPTLHFLQIFNGILFGRMDPLNVGLLTKFEIRSFSRSWDNNGDPKKLGCPWIRPRSLFSKILMGFCSDGPSEYTNQIWNPYIAFPVPEIIWDAQQIWTVPGY